MFIIIAIITHIILKHTTLGRKIYAVGGNEEASVATGINVKRTKVLTYMISGLFVGLAGIMLMSRVNSGMPTAADGYELDAIASAVIGGTSFTGGLGTAFGTVIGAIILGIISNILNLIGVQTYIQSIIKGVIILVAVVLDLQSKRKRI
ncbi:Ribose import permease protein RbsC [bioreactor metagenome]|uniref:Ribose import permease protein RbsC n=1 Tax=bioreactor metagenome TaxID=1076179 RepID=A0A645JDF0_9ZZZZ